MKKLISFVLVVAILICTLPTSALVTGAEAYGNFTYTVSNDSATITDCSESASGNLTIPETINGYTVVGIGDNAFENCDGIESVKIPYLINNIGSNIFKGCGEVIARVYENSYAYKYMLINSIDYDFIYTAKPAAPEASVVRENTIILTHHDGYEYRVSGGEWQSSPVFEGVFPDSTYIFYQRVMQTPYNPASPSSVGAYINTAEYKNGDSLYFWQNNNTISGYTGGGSQVIIPTKTNGYVINTIGNVAFENESNLVKVILPEGITTIKYRAFFNCTALKYINIPDSVTTIEDEAFLQCKSIENIELGKGVDKISFCAFEDCESLINFTLPSSLTTLDYSVFQGCENLTAFIFPKGISKMEGTFCYCNNLSTIEIPSSVTNIDSVTFDDVKNLTIYTPQGSAAAAFAAEDKTNYKIYVEYYSSAALKKIETFSKTDTSVTLVPYSGYEYRMDGGDWQDSNVFYGLQPGTKHLFYQRIKATSTKYASASSEPLWVTTKIKPEQPEKPTLLSATDTRIVLKATYGYEYKKGTKGQWQQSNIFDGLEPGTEYSFYQRVAETDSNVSSEISNVAYISTAKLTVNAPDAPIVLVATDKTVQLEAIQGYEYKVNNGTWQTSNAFTNLNPNTEYTFYQRIAETDIAYASASSAGTKVTTDKSFVSKPAPPTVKSKTDNSVTLTSIAGYEYKINNGAWQTDNTFTGLLPNTEYTFYQRIAETETTYVSDVSDGITVTTSAIVRRWRQSGSRWWYQIGNSYAVGWEEIDGDWYYFDAAGWMKKGWLKSGSKWYYFKSSGAMVTDWQKIGGVWYYFNSSGAMQTGWQKIGNTWYYFNSSGAMQTGWEKISGVWYYFKSSGAMQTGWLKSGGTWYYFTGSGAMVTGSRNIGGKVYRFNSSGACLNP